MVGIWLIQPYQFQRNIPINLYGIQVPMIDGTFFLSLFHFCFFWKILFLKFFYDNLPFK